MVPLVHLCLDVRLDILREDGPPCAEPQLPAAGVRRLGAAKSRLAHRGRPARASGRGADRRDRLMAWLGQGLAHGAAQGLMRALHGRAERREVRGVREELLLVPRNSARGRAKRRWRAFMHASPAGLAKAGNVRPRRTGRALAAAGPRHARGSRAEDDPGRGWGRARRRNGPLFRGWRRPGKGRPLGDASGWGCARVRE
eukprot:605325-Alexandrium_andersonii.AAC.1